MKSLQPEVLKFSYLNRTEFGGLRIIEHIVVILRSRGVKIPRLRLDTDVEIRR